MFGDLKKKTSAPACASENVVAHRTIQAKTSVKYIIKLFITILREAVGRNIYHSEKFDILSECLFPKRSFQ